MFEISMWRCTDELHLRAEELYRSARKLSEEVTESCRVSSDILKGKLEFTSWSESCSLSSHRRHKIRAIPSLILCVCVVAKDVWEFNIVLLSKNLTGQSATFRSILNRYGKMARKTIATKDNCNTLKGTLIFIGLAIGVDL
ncbi:hypothetical protein Tco_0587681 [Tanacetum coccineum]